MGKFILIYTIFIIHTIFIIAFLRLQNPQVDIQAMARCHRIGQTKPVVVYRLCTRGTIDEAIMKRSEAKRMLEKMVFSKELQFRNKDTLLELKRLMTTKEYKVVTSEKEGKFLPSHIVQVINIYKKLLELTSRSFL